MEVAAEQANALAGTEGAIGHQRPCGISLGQYLLMKGFPLWGDLSLDGYRSENWVAAGTVEDVMAFWSSDAEHLNTILSPNRSHLGAAVAVSDQIYVVLETALQTRTGQNQSTAYDILTNIPATQAACQGGSTINPDGSVSQYSIPIAVSTARPDGDVVHEVKYGQTLWSIAIEYGTTIEQIKRYNNLTTDAIAPGWKLLIQKGATQPAPPTPTHFVSEATPMPTVPSTPTAMTSPIESPPSANDTDVFAELGQNRTVVAALIISLSVLVAGMIGFGRKKPE
jgi:LysM repeat protein